ncbi:MAG: tetratricopeptide repeat protein [Cyanobacteria bacterium P01_H01_bin.153]
MTPDAKALLQDLKDANPAIRQAATEALWHLWYGQMGAYGMQILAHSQTLLEADKFDEAEAILTDTIQGLPDFAEAWNRRAVLHYTQRRYWKAITDCEKAIALVPYHFGALHGLGLCHMALGNYIAAIQAFRRALDVQPFATLNERLILECTALLD